MDKYYSKLFLQYCNARGYKNIKITEKEKYDFTNWLLEQERSKMFYKNYLIECGVEINTPETLELNKGILDTITEEKTCIISPYQKNRIDNPELLYFIKYKREKIDKLALTHNPYSLSDLNSIIGIDSFLVGVYGSIHDLNKYSKIGMLKLFRDILLVQTSEYYEKDKNNYLYLLKSDDKTLKKSRIKT